MPRPNGQLWRTCREKMDLTSEQAAEKLGVAGGALRQIETNVKPVSMRLAYRAERLFKEVHPGLTADDLIVDDDPQPTPEPQPVPEQPAEPKIERTAPPGRKNGDGDRKGPPRAARAGTSVAAGVA